MIISFSISNREPRAIAYTGVTTIKLFKHSHCQHLTSKPKIIFVIRLTKLRLTIQKASQAVYGYEEGEEKRRIHVIIFNKIICNRNIQSHVIVSANNKKF